MKKVFSKVLLVAICFMLSIMTTLAAARWVAGYDFSEKGKSFSNEVIDSKSYTTYLRVAQKYTEPEMKFKVSSSKGTAGIMPASTDCTVASGTGLSGRECKVRFDRIGADHVTTKITWKQSTDGHLSGDISWPSY